MSEEMLTAAGTTPGHHPIAVGSIVFDTPDPQGLAAFYAELLGWTINESDEDDWVTISNSGSTSIAFQLATDFTPPTWPDPSVPQQAHLDLWVPAYDEPEARALALGATVLEVSEGRDFRVYADPSGHPFCLCLHN